MLYRLASLLVLLVIVGFAVLWVAGGGWVGESWDAGTPQGEPVAERAIEARARALGETASSLGSDPGKHDR